MKLLATALFVSLFAIGSMTVSASAQDLATCQAQAVTKNNGQATYRRVKDLFHQQMYAFYMRVEGHR